MTLFHRRLGCAALLAALWGLQQAAALGQYSPNCWRNGRRDACAITPVASASSERQTVERITFADHTVVEALRNERSCRAVTAAVRTCNAKLTSPPNGGKTLPAFYRGTAYEGGYRHEYVGGGMHLIYVFLD